MYSDFISLETQPFEKAAINSSPRYERRNKYPTLIIVMKLSYWYILNLTMFADDPHQNFEIANAPISFYFVGLQHPC